MHQLGHTRSSHHPDHLLQTPDTFVRAPLPGMKDVTGIVHAAPAVGAAFAQYTAEFSPGGSMSPAAVQRFVFVLEGELTIDDQILTPHSYVYLPTGDPAILKAEQAARVSIIEKPYETLTHVPAPPRFIGHERDIDATPLMGDEDLEVRVLLPAGLVHDFAVNTMTFKPGATLPMVEVHVMEHGLVMLEGCGIYRLNNEWYPVQKGDFIWMGPYCPQWFGALGKTSAKYLLYKDWNRHPLS